jgi:trehalose 6-phosphate synthase/phosphatase
MGMIIVSNRLPVTFKRDGDAAPRLVKSPGGLVSGLSDVHQRVKALWLGYPGLAADHPDFGEVSRRLADSGYVAVALGAEQYQAYYSGCANSALWPLFHYALGEARFDQEAWRAYEEVNRRFAATVLDVAEPGDHVWIHDYQLMLLPKLLRDAQRGLRLAYFHHVPFPDFEMFRVLPWRTQILGGLLGADLIGLHTLDYVMHLRGCAARLLGLDGESGYLSHGDRQVRVAAFPLGVDLESIRAGSSGEGTFGSVAALAAASRDKTVFLGIDRLDYTKGLPERLAAFALFLKAHPEAIGRVTYVQVCVPSRQEVQSYAALRSEVERRVGQINGEFSRPGYVPLHYLYQPFSPAEVRQFYRLGDVALVTPLRDGLNLVCKEYVASRHGGDGVLILSEFAGAAAELGEALLVNPYDLDGLARAMHQAMVMPEPERRRRMLLLRSRVMQGDNVAWARRFIRAWNAVPLAGGGRVSQPLDDAAAARLARDLATASKLFIFADYDGTLVPIAPRPDLALPEERVLDLLRRVGAQPAVELTVVTGRSREFCERYFAALPVSIAAEHGAFLRFRGERDWTAAVDAEVLAEVRALVLPDLETYVSCTPGAHIEAKATALVLHYREAEGAFARRRAYDLRESLCRILAATPYSVFQARRAIEVKPLAATKGAAMARVLEHFGRGAEPLLTLGDDRSDEDLFRLDPETNVSIHVGRAHGAARFHVSSPRAIRRLLRAVAGAMERAREVDERLTAASRDSFPASDPPWFMPGTTS